jgi:hypothetical protein
VTWTASDTTGFEPAADPSDIRNRESAIYASEVPDHLEEHDVQCQSNLL